MSQQPDNPFEQPYQVALYRHTQCGWYTIFQYQGDRDHEYHSGYVRQSAPVDVRFNALESEAAVRTAVASLEAAEQQLVDQFRQNLQQLRAQKANLLALTHQPEDTSGAT